MRSIGVLPTAWVASEWTAMPRSRHPLAIASTGCSAPVSLLAQITLTSAVFFRVAASIASAVTQPCASGATRVTSTPRVSSVRSGSSTDGCSIEVVTTWSPGPSKPKSSVLFASVAPAAKRTVPGCAPIRAAKSAREASTRSRAAAPSAYTLDGLPQPLRRASPIASTTSGRTGVVALWSR